MTSAKLPMNSPRTTLVNTTAVMDGVKVPWAEFVHPEGSVYYVATPDVSGGHLSQDVIFSREPIQEKKKERRKTLPVVGSQTSYSGWRDLAARSLDSLCLESDLGPLKVALASLTLLPIPTTMIGDDLLDDVPRSMSPLGLDSEHGITASADLRFGAGSADLQALDVIQKNPIIDVPEDAGSHFSLGLLAEARISSRVSSSMSRYPFLSPSTCDPIPASIAFCQSAQTPWPHDTGNMIDALAKDPEALLDTQNSNTTDTPRFDPSVVVTTFITALGLLASHSSNPRVFVFQLSAAAVSFTLMALHSFHSKTLADTEQHSTFVQRLLKYFPPLIFASCWILFLLSITLASPRAMTITVSLVIFASIPMVCGARLPAVLTLAIITLFGLTFFVLVFLVCFLPTEWLA